jgi:hypothetical protein
MSDFTAQRNQVMNFDISDPERDIMNDKTSPPLAQKSKNPYENNLVLSSVRLSKQP